MIAYCGLDCGQCGAFIATRTNDDALRAKVAQEWAVQFNVPIKAEHINCTGCRSDGVKVYYCDQMCEIRKCASKKGIPTCADCESFCDTLREMHKTAPHAKTNLDGLKKQ